MLHLSLNLLHLIKAFMLFQVFICIGAELRLTMQKNCPRFSDYVFGPVPSHPEVDFAISVLESFVLTSSLDRTQPNSIVQLLNSPTSKLLISCGLEMLYRAFQLWQVDPFVKKLVVSLASDEVMWAAMMKNELIQELGKKPLFLGQRSEDETRDSAAKGAELAATMLQRIWEMAKSKVADLIESFQSLMNKMVQSGEIEKPSLSGGCDEQFKEKVTSSFLLSVLLSLIVIVVRASVV